MTTAVASAPALDFDRLLAMGLASPGRSDLALKIGLMALEQRREEDALPALTATAAHTPRDASLLHVIGLLHRALGDSRAAIAALDTALALGSASARLVHARARVAAEAGQPSLEWYARARALAPDDAEVILGQAAALSAEDEPQAGIALLSATLAQHPGWLAGHEAVIRHRHLLGDLDGAVADVDAAIAGAPRDARLHHLRAAALFRLGKADAARDSLATARAIVGDADIGFRVAAATLIVEHGTIAEAEVAFAGLDPLCSPDLFVHWLRHLVRREAFDRISDLADRLPPPLLALAWPYLSIAWRRDDDARLAWLERPELIQIADVATDWPLLDPLAMTLRDIHRTVHAPIDQSVRGGTQTDGPLLSRIDPVLGAVRQHLMQEVRRYIAALPAAEPRHPLLGHIPRCPRVIGSWSVRLSAGGYHEPHVHGEGWLSAVFYVRIPPPRDQEGWLALGEPQASLGTGLAAYREIEPQPGRLVMMPSTTWHSTRPSSPGERMTIAFDIG